MSEKLTGVEVARTALGWLGTPYRHQASAKGQGTDCLGLVRGVWRELRGEEPEILPPYSPSWQDGEGEPLLEAAQRHLTPALGRAPETGDILLFRMSREGPVKHCGIHVGNDQFVHAYDRRAVTRSRLSAWWRAKLAGVFTMTGDRERLS